MDIAAFQKILDPLFPGLMGVRLLELAPERVVAEMKVRADLCTTGGVMHGGAYMAFADTLGAVGTVLNMDPAMRTTTTDSSTKFIASAKVDTVVTAECIALHRGRTTMVWQTTIRNAAGKLCAVVTQTQLVLMSRDVSADPWKTDASRPTNESTPNVFIASIIIARAPLPLIGSGLRRSDGPLVCTGCRPC